MRNRRLCLGGNSRHGEETGRIHYVGNILLSIICLSLSRHKKELGCLTWVRKGGKELKRKRKKTRREEACPKGLFVSEKYDLKINFSLWSG